MLPTAAPTRAPTSPQASRSPRVQPHVTPRISLADTWPWMRSGVQLVAVWMKPGDGLALLWPGSGFRSASAAPCACAPGSQAARAAPEASPRTPQALLPTFAGSRPGAGRGRLRNGRRFAEKPRVLQRASAASCPYPFAVPRSERPALCSSSRRSLSISPAKAPRY